MKKVKFLGVLLLSVMTSTVYSQFDLSGCRQKGIHLKVTGLERDDTFDKFENVPPAEKSTFIVFAKNTFHVHENKVCTKYSLDEVDIELRSPNEFTMTLSGDEIYIFMTAFEDTKNFYIEIELFTPGWIYTIAEFYMTAKFLYDDSPTPVTGEKMTK